MLVRGARGGLFTPDIGYGVKALFEIPVKRFIFQLVFADLIYRVSNFSIFYCPKKICYPVPIFLVILISLFIISEKISEIQ